MLFNKKNTRKINDKKILHKVGKNWKVVSVALLMALGGTAFASHTSHADATTVNTPNVKNVNVNKNATSNNGASVSQQANAMHKQIIANNAAKAVNNNNTNTQKQSADNNNVKSANNTQVSASNNTNATKVAAPKASVSAPDTSAVLHNGDKVNNVPVYFNGSNITFGSDGNNIMNHNGDAFNDDNFDKALSSLNGSDYTINFKNNGVSDTTLPSDPSNLFNGNGNGVSASVSADAQAAAKKISTIDFTNAKLNSNSGQKLDSMLANLPNLKKVILPNNFINSDVNSTAGMFQNDSQLSEIDGLQSSDAQQDFSNVSNTSNMFKHDSALTSIDFEPDSLDHVSNASGMFQSDTNLNNAQFASVGSTFANNATLDNMFNKDTSLRYASNLPGLDITGAKSVGNMFANSGIMNVLFTTNPYYNDSTDNGEDTLNLNIDGISNLSTMFQNDSNLNSVTFANKALGTNSVTNGMFQSDKNLNNVKFNNSDALQNVQSAQGMFQSDGNTVNNAGFTSINLNNALNNDSDLQNIVGMFQNNPQLKNVNFGFINTKNSVNTYNAFVNDNSLETLTVADTNDSNALKFSGSEPAIMTSNANYNASSKDAYTIGTDINLISTGAKQGQDSGVVPTYYLTTKSGSNTPVVFRDQSGKLIYSGNEITDNHDIVVSSDWPSYNNPSMSGDAFNSEANANEKNNVISDTAVNNTIAGTGSALNPKMVLPNGQTYDKISGYDLTKYNINGLHNSDSGNHVTNGTNGLNVYSEGLAYNNSNSDMTVRDINNNNNSGEYTVIAKGKPYFVINVTGKNHKNSVPVNVQLENSDGTTKSESQQQIELSDITNGSSDIVSPQLVFHYLNNNGFNDPNYPTNYKGYTLDANQTPSDFQVTDNITPSNPSGLWTWTSNTTPTIYLKPVNSSHNDSDNGGGGYHPLPSYTDTDTINFMDNGSNVGTTTVKGNDGDNYTVPSSDVPSGYQLANDGTQNFEFENGSHNVNVKKNNTPKPTPQPKVSLSSFIGALVAAGII